MRYFPSGILRVVVVVLVLQLIGLSYLFFNTPATKADELEDIAKEIAELEKAKQMSENATKPLESEVAKLEQRLNSIQASMKQAEVKIKDLETDIDQREKDFDKQYELLSSRVEKYYKNLRRPSDFLLIFSKNSLGEMARELSYRRSASEQDKLIIASISTELSQLEKDKQKVEEDKKTLESLRGKLASQSEFFKKEIKGAKEYQKSLGEKIAQLSQKQKELLAQKLASLNIPQSAYTTQGGCESDLTNGKDPGFSPRFGFFTYGVPHRVGMNQYGAKGRAEAGQDARKILEAYYNAEYKTGYRTDITLHVTGSNEYGQSFDDRWSIEDYLKHIYEVPTNWPKEALKAQAIAARSYALAVTNDGQNTICPSQQCQVVKKEENSDAWKQAVKETEGIVLASGGRPVKAWFSSTSGGYAHSSGSVGWNDTAWTKNMRDTSGDINSFAELQDKAYDKASPWFYCDWGARAEYSKTAWLKPEEVADIVNVLMLAKKDGSTQNHLTQLDKPNPDGEETWDKERVKRELRDRQITPYNSISSVNIDWDKGFGKTNTVSVSGDAGSNSFNGDEFKNYFNLRAPANIQIVGPLYNIEKR